MNRISRLSFVLVVALSFSAFGQDSADDAKKFHQQSQELAKEKKLDEAIAAIKKAIDLAPKNDIYLATASELEFNAGKYVDGFEHALQAIKLNNKVGQYLLAASNALYDQDIDNAREYSEIVLKRADEFGTGPSKDARIIQDLVSPRTYTLFWKLDPKKVRTVGQLTVTLPKGDLPYQTVTFEVTGAQSHRLAKGEVNDLLHLVPKANETIELTTKVTVKPYSFKKELVKATPKPTPPDIRRYLTSCDTINLNSPTLKKIAAPLKGKNNVETARNILTWMKKNIEYKLEKTKLAELDYKSVDDIIQRGHAECKGYSMLYTALCRAADVPARPMWGLTRVGAGMDRQFGDIASHNWAEVFVAGVGWVPVDPQRPETFGLLPVNCIRMFMDEKKTKTSTELFPMFNLLATFGGKLRFEVSR